MFVDDDRSFVYHEHATCAECPVGYEYPLDLDETESQGEEEDGYPQIENGAGVVEAVPDSVAYSIDVDEELRYEGADY